MKALIINGSGTLIDSTLSGFAMLADAIGKKQEMLEHQAHYYKVRQNQPWGSEEFAEMFKGTSQELLMQKAREIVKKTLRSGAGELIKRLKAKGYITAFYSTDPMEIALALQEELGFDDVFGTLFEYKDNIVTGKLAKKFDRYDRAGEIKEFIEKNNLKKEDVFIVGDSITAVPSAEFGRIISFNSKNAELDKIAEFKVKNFPDILKYLTLFIFITFLAH
jgi:phosphoserine phosphatase